MAAPTPRLVSVPDSPSPLMLEHQIIQAMVISGWWTTRENNQALSFFFLRIKHARLQKHSHSFITKPVLWFLSPLQHVTAIPKGLWMPAAVNWGASVSAKPTSWDAAVTPALQAATASASMAAIVSTWQLAPVPGSTFSCIPQLFRALSP